MSQGHKEIELDGAKCLVSDDRSRIAYFDIVDQTWKVSEQTTDFTIPVNHAFADRTVAVSWVETGYIIY